MRMTPAERRRRLLEIPWISYVKKGQPCDGKRYSHMPIKAIRSDDPKWNCKVSAHWRYVHSRRGQSSRRGQAHVYCMHHLFSLGLYGDMAEQSRYDAWRKRHA